MSAMYYFYQKNNTIRKIFIQHSEKSTLIGNDIPEEKNKIVSIITFLDRKNRLISNPIHMIFFLIIALPVIYMYWQIHPVLMSIFAIFVIIQFVLFFLKLLVKEKYNSEIQEVKNSVPSFNLFHIIMFAIIAAPVLGIVYGVISSTF